MIVDEYLFSCAEYSFPALSQKVFCQILNEIILEMTKNNIQMFSVAPENIKITKNNDNFEFSVIGLDIYRNNQTTVSDYVKMKPICELILQYYETRIDSIAFNASSYLNMHQEAITELKDLIRVAYNEKTYFNFEFFCDTIIKINLKFSENNYFEVIPADPLTQRLKPHGILDNGLTTSRINENQPFKKIKISQKLVSCNHCGQVNLLPVFHLSKCGCNLHKNCLENSLIEYGIDPVLYEEKLTNKCELFNQHFSYDDLIVIHDNQHRGFEINRQVKSFIKYFFLNPQTNTPSKCDCPEDNRCKVVNKDTKKPSRNCAGLCSFCGKKHRLEHCKDFLSSLD